MSNDFLFQAKYTYAKQKINIQSKLDLFYNFYIILVIRIKKQQNNNKKERNKR